MIAPDDWLRALENHRRLDEPGRLRERVEVLDRLERHYPDAAGDDTHAGPDPHDVHARGRALRRRLEAADERLFRSIRTALRHGVGASALAPWMRSATGPDGCAAGDTYDHFDTLVSGILPFDEPGPPTVAPATDMVFYQPTPARHIFDLLQRTDLGAGDVLMDLGAGLGHVPLLAAICTGACGIGIEREPAYVACARRAARSLGADRVRFDVGDVRDADLSAATVYYLYTPFRGTILRAVLDALRGQAERRAIRVCTYGPCTAEVAAEAWLRPMESVTPGRVAIFAGRTGTRRPVH